MDASRTLSDLLLVAASRELKGKARRAFVAKVCQSLCGGSSRKATEEKTPQLKIDIACIVEPHTHSDPELKTERQYTNLSAREVQAELIKRGYAAESLPAERTIRDILNRMNYRLKRIQKGKPLKKTEHTDAIFENVHAAREKYKDDPEALEISVDTKAKVSLGEYVLGGKSTNR